MQRRAKILRIVATALIATTSVFSFAHAEERERDRNGRERDETPPPVDPVATTGERFQWFGESLGYSISILGDTVARTGFSVSEPIVHDQWGTVVALEGGAFSTGFFALVYPMNDTALTYVDPQTGLPVWTSKTIDERNQVRTYDVAFRRNEYLAAVERHRDGRTDRYSRFGPTDLHDALTWIVDLRSRDLSVGSSHVYYIYDGWKMSRLTVRVVRNEDVYTALGFIPCAEMTFTREVLASAPALPWADNNFLVPPVYFVTDGPEEIGRGWFSTDERRLPVGTEITTPIGRLRVMLDTWDPPG